MKWQVCNLMSLLFLDICISYNIPSCFLQRARSDMEVFVGAFVHSTEETPMVILPGMVMGVLNTKVRMGRRVGWVREKMDNFP